MPVVFESVDRDIMAWSLDMKFHEFSHWNKWEISGVVIERSKHEVPLGWKKVWDPSLCTVAFRSSIMRARYLPLLQALTLPHSG